MLLSILLIFGVLVLPVLIILWVLYLSLVNIGQMFMSFQWDALLLEAGFLAFFLAPLGFIQKLSSESSPSVIVLWLNRFLLFRLIISSGIGKLASGDPTWRDFTALNFHYYTQPLPTPIAWYIHHLPEWFHKISVGLMFFSEIVIPLFIFAPRRLRFLAGIAIIFLQIIILSTGNYTFFNLLTIVLCVLLFDDRFLQRFFPKKIKTSIGRKQKHKIPRSASYYRKIGIGILTVVIIFLGTVQLGRTIIRYRDLPQVLQKVIRLVSPYRVVNHYGLFTVMTTSRPEIIIEGSNDGQNWQEYGFKYKPGELGRSLPWVAPHQPRLDWQMWFAALGSYQTNPWFTNFMMRLLEGSPEVLKLLDKNPFPDEPPKYLRAEVYEYNFTDPHKKVETNNLWQRELLGLYLPILALPHNQ